MTIAPLLRRFLADYGRNPVNLLMLVLVPGVFVGVAAGAVADAAQVLGGPGGPAVTTATAGWAAGFLAALAMYFPVSSARQSDKRLVLAGLPPARLVGARLVTGLALTLLVTAVSLTALLLRAGIEAPGRVLAGTLMGALIYLALGAVIGAFVRNPVNGTVLILFVWILDVFFGPAFGSVDRVSTRWLPTHFVTLWMVDLPSRHGGRPGDLGWALAWTVGALVLSWFIVVRSARTARARPAPRPATTSAQLRGSIRMGLREHRRNPVLWVLLAVVPVVFILLAKGITPDVPTTMPLLEQGRAVLLTFPLPDTHGATMAPIAVGALAALAGMFILVDARAGDQRLIQAGARSAAVLAARLAVIGAAVLLVTVVSLTVTATVFAARQWVLYAGATAVIALTYAMIGVIIGPVFGRVAGVFIAFLVPFLDLGMGQSPMLRPEPPTWAQYVPGYGATRVLLDAGFTDTFDRAGSLLVALAWLAGLTLVAVVIWRRPVTQDAGPSRLARV